MEGLEGFVKPKFKMNPLIDELIFDYNAVIGYLGFPINKGDKAEVLRNHVNVFYALGTQYLDKQLEKIEALDSVQNAANLRIINDFKYQLNEALEIFALEWIGRWYKALMESECEFKYEDAKILSNVFDQIKGGNFGIYRTTGLIDMLMPDFKKFTGLEDEQVLYWVKVRENIMPSQSIH